MLIKELIALMEATNRPKPKKKVVKEPDSPFEHELDALRARQGRPGKKSDLTDKEIARLRQLEILAYSEDDPPGGNKDLIPSYGPFLARDIKSTREGRAVWLLKVTTYEEFVGNVGDFDSGVKDKDNRDVGGNGTPRTPKAPRKKGGGGDKKVQLKVQVVSDYYNKNDAKYDKFFEDSKSGYMQAAEYFLELLNKLG